MSYPLDSDVQEDVRTWHNAFKRQSALSGLGKRNRH